MSLNLPVEIEREDDGRWIAEIPALPGVMAYGETPERATALVTALAFRVLADQVENGQRPAANIVVAFSSPSH